MAAFLLIPWGDLKDLCGSGKCSVLPPATWKPGSVGGPWTQARWDWGALEPLLVNEGITHRGSAGGRNEGQAFPQPASSTAWAGLSPLLPLRPGLLGIPSSRRCFSGWVHTQKCLGPLSTDHLGTWPAQLLTGWATLAPAQARHLWWSFKSEILNKRCLVLGRKATANWKWKSKC